MNNANPIVFSREWAMPNADTFCIRPIRKMVLGYLETSKVSCDPFARNSALATYTNDINPTTSAQYHLDAVSFLQLLAQQNVKCDLAILDPPYSPRQISESYQVAGIPCGMRETQNARLYADVRAALLPVLTDDATVLSFGWNSTGMGKQYGFTIVELMLVCHGSAHNDTICLAETRGSK